MAGIAMVRGVGAGKGIVGVTAGAGGGAAGVSFVEGGALTSPANGGRSGMARGGAAGEAGAAG